MRSIGSVHSAAFLKCSEQCDQKSTMRWIEERGSKILIGSEMWEIDKPFNMLTANCLATFDKTPDYF